jgi:phosphatidylglycerophosphate synthase
MQQLVAFWSCREELVAKDRWKPIAGCPPTQAIIVGDCTTRIWGMPAAERLRRQLTRARIVDIVEDRDAPAGSDGPALLVRSDRVFEEGLLRALIDAPGTLLLLQDDAQRLIPVAAHVDGDNVAAAVDLLRHPESFEIASVPDGVTACTPTDLVPAFNRFLRRRSSPYVLPLTPTTRRDIEWRTFRAAYKGATDFVTKYVWPIPAFHVTRWCAARALTPNMVTTIGLVLCVIAALLFAEGLFLVGAAVGWAMTFLDTVDGKLARCTLTSSNWGDTYDHGIDLVHPPLWWWAWWVGLGATGTVLDGTLFVALCVILVGYVVGRIIEGTFRKVFGLSPHVWKPVDYWFRVITARRNPNLAILTAGAAVGYPAEAFIAVAAWTVVSLIYHGVRFAQAMRQQRRGRLLSSYLNADGTPPIGNGTISAQA